MANIVTSLVSTIIVADTGGANPETIQGSLVGPVTIEDTSDTLVRGNKVDKAVGARHQISGSFFIHGAGSNGFAHIDEAAGVGVDLFDNMLTQTEIRLILTFQGDSSFDVWTYDPGLMVITPRIVLQDQLKASLLFHDDGSADAPSGYVDSGAILGGASPGFEAITVPDGQGRQIYVRTVMTFEPMLIDMSSAGDIATADADNDDMVRMAIARGTSAETYYHFDDVNLVKEVRGVGDELNTVNPILQASWRDYRTGATPKIEWPTNPENFHHGFDFVMICAGVVEGDFLTIA